MCQSNSSKHPLTLSSSAILSRLALFQTALAALVLVVLLPACRQTQPKGTALSPAATGQATLHAVHSDQLKSIMGRMQNLAFDRLPQELDPSTRKRAEMQRAAAVTADLAKAVTQIPEAIDGVTLPQEERAVFLKLAHQLGTQAAQLNREAEAMNLDQFDATMREMTATCIACHTLFRNISGTLPEENR